MTASNLQERVAEEIRALLARRQISARQVAHALGWTDVYISRRLNNRTAFDLHDLEAIASALEIPIGALFGQREESPQLLSTVPGRSSIAEGNKSGFFVMPLTSVSPPPELSLSGEHQPLVA